MRVLAVVACGVCFVQLMLDTAAVSLDSDGSSVTVSGTDAAGAAAAFTLSGTVNQDLIGWKVHAPRTSNRKRFSPTTPR